MEHLDALLVAFIVVGIAILAVVIHDLFISKDNILRNFPLIGHLRYFFIEIGPELRQYIVAGNREEQPFNREEREWIYRSARGGNNYFGFGTDDQIYHIGYPIIKHSMFPFGEVSHVGSVHDAAQSIPCAKILGETHDRPKSWRPGSIVNISAMSFGALSANAIEALNRGAKLAGCYHNTGKGGVLPGAKVTAEIAGIRGVRAGEDCVSPNSHREFTDVRSMIRFIEEISGGTGAAPLTFADHVSLPYKVGFTRVYKTFLDEKMTDRVAWIGSGKLGFPDRAVIAMALGADLINMARGAMLSIGCIQAQQCHTDRCPSGVATQSPYLQRGLEPRAQSQRFMRFCQSLRNEILAVTHACGYEHPSQFTLDDIEMATGAVEFSTLREVYGYAPEKRWSGIAGWDPANAHLRSDELETVG